ncbi:Ribosome_biogenesis protein NEP1 [Hexamita inflata]|uniref:Putative n=1 Tax=Hexamita inflata TaxID=28002 RepID=A0AA86NIC8_9EUKA|nr:Ribosome biogenesis protein NEP1 [Hexamita inflata]CAI9956803.1 Ribosome biogenesis protein NEP1 [Hexamita inflata]CAI9970900.1 Ribosome biogenesis protein NEP1 [Hexamita inflata]
MSSLNQAVKKTQKLTVVVENAFLETIQVRDKYQLLNSDDHHAEMARAKRPMENARPDIVHQLLLQLFDSPLNKAGLLQVYIRTNQNQIIHINHTTKIPRTFARFCGLMVQLLYKHQIRAAETNEILMRLIAGPITKHLPMNKPVVELEYEQGSKIVPINEYVQKFKEEEEVVFVIGGFARGNVEIDYSTEKTAISQYPLSAAAVAARVTAAFENLWGVI